VVYGTVSYRAQYNVALDTW